MILFNGYHLSDYNFLRRVTFDCIIKLFICIISVSLMCVTIVVGLLQKFFLIKTDYYKHSFLLNGSGV